MNFEQEIVPLIAEIQRRQAEVTKMQAEGWALHDSAWLTLTWSG